MRKNSTLLRNSGTYTSPSTPEYGDKHVGGIQKGWCSERVPLPTNSNRRNVTATALMPFSNNGRAFPSKWDDAERWITSPLSSYGVCKTSAVQPHRHAKSKSGPLGTPGLMYMPNFSPAVPFVEGEGVISNFTGSSPFTTGVLVPEGLCIHYGAAIDSKANSMCADKRIARACSVPGLSDLLSEAFSLPSSQDDKLDMGKVAETDDLHVVSRRDMATQMSPDESTHSSPKERLSLCSFPLPIPIADEQNKHFPKMEIRDVQVDRGDSVSNHRSRKLEKGSPNAIDSSLWNNVDATTRSVSKEEARISAWENLQKAKAEAAIQKLEMKLEKKRSASMNKILNKLRYAQTKAQEMRGAVSEKHNKKASNKAVPFGKRFKVSFGSCFSCHTVA
ncbi:unnamed protein product [Cuscuta campestris]|uniref:Remorin C-terminal domain-containing protein n=1 Tax=Cuscuta campestris TaxID=132261 RepID=A0A484L231_9ASTE|nr:unnamed protein product [Cuscuta campestris]